MSKIRSLFTRHLLLANTLTCCAQGATGDFLEQLITGRIQRDGWNPHQTGIMAGAKLMLGPPMHLFYHILDGRKFRGSRVQIVFKKLFWDTLCNPIISFGLVTSAALLEGQSTKAALLDYKSKFFDYAKVDFILWPCAQFLNFFFVPHHYRVLFVNGVTLVDCTLISFIRKRTISE